VGVGSGKWELRGRPAPSATRPGQMADAQTRSANGGSLKPWISHMTAHMCFRRVDTTTCCSGSSMNSESGPGDSPACATLGESRFESSSSCSCCCCGLTACCSCSVIAVTNRCLKVWGSGGVTSCTQSLQQRYVGAGGEARK
jgi:hypothetical protein